MQKQQAAGDFSSKNPLSVARLRSYKFFGAESEELGDKCQEYGLYDISAAEAQARGFTNTSDGIWITYPNDADSRIRYNRTGFAAQQDVGKYGQRPNTLPAVYYPPGISETHLTDGEIPLLIIEGEFKALSVHHVMNNGFQKPNLLPIALGGVWSWQSKKSGIGMLPRLKELVTHNRMVYIAFDMDNPINPQVQKALSDLVAKLSGLTMNIKVLSWPSTEGKGLDDYMAGKALPRSVLQNLLMDAVIPGYLLQVLQMNEQFTYDRIQDAVYDFNTGAYVKPQTFKSHYFTEELKFNIFRNNKTTTKCMMLGDYWLSSPAHACCEGKTFAPGAERLVQPNPDRPAKQINTWKAWGAGSDLRNLQPVKGDVGPFISYLQATFSKNKVVVGEKEADCVDYLLKRMAWMFQHPQIKHPTWIYLIGAPMQGKSKLINILSRLIGHTYTSHIDEGALSSSFQDWRAEKLLIAFDDVAITERSTIKQVLKRLTTENTARVNRKYEKEYTAKSFETFFFATNSLDALLDHDDRRALVLEAACPWTKEEWQVFDKWAGTPSSYDALLHYLLYEVKIDDTFLTLRPPLTEMRQLVTESAESGWDELLNNLAAPMPVMWSAPADGKTRKFKPSVMTPDMLKALYNLLHGQQDSRVEIKNATLTAKLQRFGATRCHPNDSGDTRGRIYIDGKQHIIWCWDKKWARASAQEIKDELIYLSMHVVPELFVKGGGRY